MSTSQSTLTNRKKKKQLKEEEGTTTTETTEGAEQAQEQQQEEWMTIPPLTNPTEEQLAELGESVTFLTHPDTQNEVYVVGTAHISEESMQDVKRVMEAVKPHIVVIELDRTRISLLQNNQSREDIQAFLDEPLLDQLLKAYKEQKSASAIIGTLLARFSRALLLKLDVDPKIYGGEFKMAVSMAKRCKSKLIFGDRDIQTTIQRTWSVMTWPQTFYGLWEVVTSLDLNSFDDLTTEDIEELKNKDTLEYLLSMVKDTMPNVFETMISERDQFLAASMLAASGTVLVVPKTESSEDQTDQQQQPQKDNTGKTRQQIRRDSFNESLQKNSRMVRQGSLKKLQDWMAKKSADKDNDGNEKESTTEDSSSSSSCSPTPASPVNTPKLRVVGVVGAGHVPGIVKAWNGPKIDTASLMKVPKVMSIRQFVIILLLLLLFVLYLMIHGLIILSGKIFQ